MKEIRQTVLLSEEDVRYVASLLEKSDDQEEEINLGDDYETKDNFEVDQADEYEIFLAHATEQDIIRTQEFLENVSFIHCRTVNDKRDAIVREIYINMSRQPQRTFYGVNIDTRAN